MLALALTFAAALDPLTGRPAGAQRPASDAPSHAVQGVVRDAGSGQPLAGVRVRAGGRTLLTDSSGAWRAAVASETIVLHFARLGYQAVSVPARDAGVVALVPRPVSLATVTTRADARDALAVGTTLPVASVDRAAIGARGITSVAEALDAIAGVSVMRPGAWGARAVIRGLGGERVNVMVDGNPVRRACTSGMDQGVAAVDPASVERVEVLAGPGSALYGSGSIGGVINVVTRRPDAHGGLSGEARLGGSTGVPGGAGGVTLRHRGGALETDLSVDVARYGDYRAPGGTVEGSSFEQQSATLALRRALTARQTATLEAQFYDARDIGFPAMANTSIPMEQRYMLAAEHGWQRSGGVVDGVATRAYVQRLEHHMTTTMMKSTPGGPMAMTTDARSHSVAWGGRSQIRLIPAAGSLVDAGVELAGWDAEASRYTGRGNVMPDIDLHTWPGVRLADLGAYAQGEVPLGRRVTASGGIRVDHVWRTADGREGEDEWVGTGNVGARVALPAGFSLRAGWGAGYRTPDPTELFGVAIKHDGFIYAGNADLRTETSRNLEAGLAWERARFGGSVTAFRNAISDMIAPRLSPGDSLYGMPVRVYANLQSARITGGAVTAHATPITSVSFSASGAWTRGTDDDTGAPLVAIPPLEGTVSTRVSIGRGLDWAEVAWRAASGQERVAAQAGEQPTPGYGLLDVRSGATVLGTEVVAGLENVFDRAYRSHLDSRRIDRTGRNLVLRMTRRF